MYGIGMGFLMFTLIVHLLKAQVVLNRLSTCHVEPAARHHDSRAWQSVSPSKGDLMNCIWIHQLCEQLQEAMGTIWK